MFELNVMHMVHNAPWMAWLHHVTPISYMNDHDDHDDSWCHLCRICYSILHEHLNPPRSGSSTDAKKKASAPSHRLSTSYCSWDSSPRSLQYKIEHGRNWKEHEDCYCVELVFREESVEVWKHARFRMDKSGSQTCEHNRANKPLGVRCWLVSCWFATNWLISQWDTSPEPMTHKKSHKEMSSPFHGKLRCFSLSMHLRVTLKDLKIMIVTMEPDGTWQFLEPPWATKN